MAADKDSLSPEQAEPAGEAEANHQDWSIRASRGGQVHSDRVLWEDADRSQLQSGRAGKFQEVQGITDPVCMCVVLFWAVCLNVV